MRESRQEVLEVVNRVFDRHGLPRWTDLRRIGRHRKGEFEIAGVERVETGARDYYITVVFSVIRPDGMSGTYAVRFSRPGAAVVVVVNGMVVFVKQHRLPVGKWTIEVPRGWIPRDAASDPGAIVRAILSGEIGESWTASLDSFHPVCVGEVADDTGYHALVVPVYYLESQTLCALPRKCGVHIPRMYSWEGVEELEEQGILFDAHSLAALRLVERHLRKRGRSA